MIVFVYKSVDELCHAPTGLKPMSFTAMALMCQYLNVCQRKLGTIIIQTVHILQQDSENTGSLLIIEDFLMHNLNYFQITLPENTMGLVPPSLEISVNLYNVIFSQIKQKAFV
jgi:hypothetical protein